MNTLIVSGNGQRGQSHLLNCSGQLKNPPASQTVWVDVTSDVNVDNVDVGSHQGGYSKQNRGWLKLDRIASIAFASPNLVGLLKKRLYYIIVHFKGCISNKDFNDNGPQSLNWLRCHIFHGQHI